MRNVVTHGMFVCEICDQEFLDEKESEVEEGVCKECISETDYEDYRVDLDEETFYPVSDDDLPNCLEDDEDDGF